jgi:hypothetical protein
MSSPYMMNQFSPNYFQGLQLDPNASAEPKSFDYVYNPPNNELTANQEIDGDTVSIQTDADFYAFGWYISLYTGAFQIRLTDSTGYQLQSGFINSGAISQSSNSPTVFSPSHLFPAGSKILIDIADLSGNPNPLQIIFRGNKLYKINGLYRTSPK